jgi:hypothetical protein
MEVIPMEKDYKSVKNYNDKTQAKIRLGQAANLAQNELLSDDNYKMLDEAQQELVFLNETKKYFNFLSKAYTQVIGE